MSEIIVDVNYKYFNSQGKTGNTFWNSIRIHKSLDEICHTVELEIPASERNKIHKHDTIIARFKNPYITDNAGTRPVTTVLVDSVSDNLEKDSKTVTVACRSPARDIIDSVWDGMLNGFTLTGLLGTDTKTMSDRIATRFGLIAQHMPTTSDCTIKIQTFSWENESPWQKLLGHADCQGYIITSNQAGNLYVWQPGWNVDVSGFYLTEGVNIKRLQVLENGAEQFHEYVVRGYNKEARVIDPDCKGKRILTINLTDNFYSEEELKRRAQTEMRRRKENKIIATVSGWGLTDEQIRRLGNTYQKELSWEPNFVIPVTIPSQNIKSRLLVSEVEYIADNQVCETNITLVKQDAFR